MLAGDNFNLTFTMACVASVPVRGERNRTRRRIFFRIRIKRIVSSFLGQKKNIRIFVVGLTNRIESYKLWL